MTGIFRDTPSRLRQQAGARLRSQREALGLKRSGIAAAMGYRNLSKGSRRIAEWEQGTFGPLLDDAAFFAALRLDRDALDPFLLRAAQIETRIRTLSAEVMKEERMLLAAHAGLLRTHAQALAKQPELRSVHSPALSLRVLWMGGGSLSVGALTAAWAAGALVADSEAHGPIWLFEGAGSALSGAGRCTGVDATGTVHQIRQSPTRFFGRDAPRTWLSKDPHSPLCLADVVASLGAPVPRVQFFLLDENGLPEDHPLAVYDPNTRLFHRGQGDAVLLDNTEQDGVTVDRFHAGVSVGGGRPRPLQLAPGWHLGAFEGDAVAHPCGLRLSQGCIEGREGWLPIRVVGPCPPHGVLPFLADLLSENKALQGPA